MRDSLNVRAGAKSLYAAKIKSKNKTQRPPKSPASLPEWLRERTKNAKYKLIIINSQYNLFHIRSHEMQIDRNFYTKYWTSFEEKQGKKKSLRKAAESAAMKRQGRKLEIDWNLWICKGIVSWLSRVITKNPEQLLSWKRNAKMCSRKI